jgi:DNA gyrase subunit A
MGRATQGVKLINLKGNDSIAAVAKVMHDEDSVDEEEESTGELADEGAGTTIDTPQED